jgi:hypothetical protein
MPSNQSPRADSLMRRQLAKQQRQQEQQQQADRFRPAAGKDLPAKQDQTRHNPVTETLQRGAFASDQ